MPVQLCDAINICDMLLQFGADVNGADADGRTAGHLPQKRLHSAVMSSTAPAARRTAHSTERG